jgi:hypoxanthine phosphoribosyltransferase
MDLITIGEDVFEVMIPEEKLQARVTELGNQLRADYAGKTPIFIGILNGSFIFMADLVKAFAASCEIDFFKLSSYGDAKISSGHVRLLKELNCDVNGRDLIIVEDIVDSGLSIKYMEQLMEQHNPKSVRVVSLLMKPESVKYDVKIDYIGFEIPGRFVIGYGLDYKQQYRNLRAIYALK